MFFKTSNVSAEILSVIQMGWQRVNARAGYRPFHTLSYRLVGDATFLSDGRESLRVGEGEIVFVPAKYGFAKQAGQGKILAVHFTSDSDLPNTLLRFSPQNSSHFRTEFLKLHQVWTEKKPGFEYAAKILLYKIILDMEQEWSQTGQSPGSRRLQAAVEHINEHFAEGAVSVDELARMCGMSDTYFRKLFVSEFGVTPQQYISRLRLGAATELLQSGYYTVSEIASRCGFNNINYFSTFIKKETGLSPLHYRNQLLYGGENGTASPVETALRPDGSPE